MYMYIYIHPYWLRHVNLCMRICVRMNLKICMYPNVCIWSLWLSCSVYSSLCLGMCVRADLSTCVRVCMSVYNIYVLIVRIHMNVVWERRKYVTLKRIYVEYKIYVNWTKNMIRKNRILFVLVSMHVYRIMYTLKCVCIYALSHVCVWVCVHMYIYIYIYIYMYIYVFKYI